METGLRRRRGPEGAAATRPGAQRGGGSAVAQKLDEKYFPRRPTLMPQLLRAMKDPSVGAGALATIIARGSGTDRRHSATGEYQLLPHLIHADRDHPARGGDLRDLMGCNPWSQPP